MTYRVYITNGSGTIPYGLPVDTMTLAMSMKQEANQAFDCVAFIVKEK